jgi:hypothetical protein
MISLLRCRPIAAFQPQAASAGGNRNHPIYSITTNQAAIIALFRVINRYVGNLPPMPGVFPTILHLSSGMQAPNVKWS